MAYAYVVHGSDDGVVAVAGTMKRACAIGLDYLREGGETCETLGGADAAWHVTMYGEKGTYVEITRFEIV